MNPVDWIAWVYGKFLSHYPSFVAYVVFGILGAALFLIFLNRGIDKYHEEHPRSQRARVPNETGIRLKMVGAQQYLLDAGGGIYVVVPDVQLSNPDDESAIVNIELQIERTSGVFDIIQSSASRIPEIEVWLANHGMANPNFLGRQINIPPKSGINGYMVFHADKFHLEMSGIRPQDLQLLRLSFQLEQFGRTPRTVSTVEAIIGHK